MKKIAVAAVLLVALAVAAIVALPLLVPAGKIRDELTAQVKAATGRELVVQGKMDVSVFPSLSLQVTDVALSNPPGFTGRDLVRLGALDVRLKLLPLLSGRVEVDSFVLLDPVVSLETDRQGRGNWVVSSPTAGAAPARSAAAEEKSAAGGAALSDLRLGDVRVVNGRLTWLDGKTGARQEVSDVNLAIHLPSLDAPLSAKGRLTWQGTPIDLAIDAAKPRAFLDGAVTDAGLAVTAEPVKLSFKGSIDAGKGNIGGDLDLSVPSVRRLVQWTTTKPLDAPGSGFGPLSVKGHVAAGGGKVAFTQAAIALDAIKAGGDVTLDSTGPRPSIKGRLDVDTLDLNPYLAPDGQDGAAPAAAAQGPAGGKAAKSDWSDQPIDASALKAADVDFTLSVQAMKIRAIQVGRGVLHLVINNGRMTTELTQMALYGGTGKGRLAVDGSAPGAVGLDAAFALKDMQAAPFLKDAAGFDRLEGTAAFDAQVSGKGRTQRQLISDLGGKGQVKFLNGAIKGINLAAMVRNVTSAFTAASADQKTDFAELSGTWTMAKGLLANKDLALMSPLLRVQGAGTVDLPRRSLDYRIEPKAAATLQGQGGKADISGIMVPVIVQGPWDNLTFRPDLGSMVKEGVGKAVEGALSGKAPTSILPAGSGSGSPASPLPIDPGKLFGR